MSCVCLLCGAPTTSSILGDRRRRLGRSLLLNKPGGVLCRDCESEMVPIQGEVCRRCGRPLISEATHCCACRERESSLSNAAALEYRGRPRELIARYKLSGMHRLRKLLAGVVISALGPQLRDCILVPVPASPERRRLLGWDPVYELARTLAAPLDLEILRLLDRRAGTQQKELGYLDRLENASRLFEYRREATMGAFEDSPRGSVKGAEKEVPPLVLFDDIYTTGATLAICRQIIADAGWEVTRSFTLAVD